MARRRRSGMRNNSRSLVVSNRSVIATVSSDAGGTYTWNTPLNPANMYWLNNIAKGFEKYRFISAVVEYVPFTGANTDGRVFVNFFADPATAIKWDALSTSDKISAMDRAGNSASSCVSAACKMVIPPSYINQWKFGEYAHTAGVAIERQEDEGHIVIAAAGLPASRSALGQFYLRYSVELMDPVSELVG